MFCSEDNLPDAKRKDVPNVHQTRGKSLHAMLLPSKIISWMLLRDLHEPGLLFTSGV